MVQGQNRLARTRRDAAHMRRCRRFVFALGAVWSIERPPDNPRSRTLPMTCPIFLAARRGTPMIAALFALAMAAGAALAQQPADGGKVIARVDGMDITEGEIAIAEEDLGRNLGNSQGEERRAQIIQYIADLKVGAKTAQTRKIDETPDFTRRLAFLKNKILVDELLAQEVKKAVTEEAMKKLYDETVSNLAPELEVRARHILVETEDEAKKVVERLEKGEDFAKLAAELSKDPGSGKEGGDLGYFAKDRMVKEFADVAFATEKGKRAAPVKSQFGWHIILVEDRRTKEPPSFETVKPQIEQYLARRAQSEFLLAQRGANKVERLDKPAEAPAEPKKP
jgi:peptidyl-prolyl cis-trans isomerase C